MALSARMQLRHKQSMALTPQLVQSIKLLQYTYEDLQQFVELEIEKNPLLIKEKPHDERSLDELEPLEGEKSENIQSIDREIFAGNLVDERRADVDTPRLARTNTYNEDQSFDKFENIAAQEPSLRESLISQFSFLSVNTRDRLIALDLIDSLTDAGYFQTELFEIAAKLDAKVEHVEHVLGLLKECEPAGVFARDLAECLALQLARKGKLTQLMDGVCQNLNLLAKRDFAKLEKILGVDRQILFDALQEIQRLNPKPGAGFRASPIQSVFPDVFVKVNEDGELIVELNNDVLPKVLVDNSYVSALRNGQTSVQDRSYLSECLQNASWLTKSLEQRAQTILKVASCIARYQKEFFTERAGELVPLTMKVVADDIKMHESTVSRVVNGKFILTPNGMFEMKFFFSSAIAASKDGQSHSGESVKQKIKGMISTETVDNVVSDDVLVRLLKAEGIEIARRTVAKYRTALNLPSSVQRRRELQAKLSKIS